MKAFPELIKVVRRKCKFDENNCWYEGAHSYLDAIPEELREVKEAVEQGHKAHIEDELGDVLWNVLNGLLAMEKEQGIQVEQVIQRAVQKYEERLNAIENQQSWTEIKQRQKQRLAEETTLLENNQAL